MTVTMMTVMMSLDKARFASCSSQAELDGAISQRYHCWHGNAHMSFCLLDYPAVAVPVSAIVSWTRWMLPRVVNPVSTFAAIQRSCMILRFAFEPSIRSVALTAVPVTRSTRDYTASPHFRRLKFCNL